VRTMSAMTAHVSGVRRASVAAEGGGASRKKA
jgi:hypothetical protein